jgi:hypothetical protein
VIANKAKSRTIANTHIAVPSSAVRCTSRIRYSLIWSEFKRVFFAHRKWYSASFPSSGRRKPNFRAANASLPKTNQPGARPVSHRHRRARNRYRIRELEVGLQGLHRVAMVLTLVPIYRSTNQWSAGLGSRYQSRIPLPCWRRGWLCSLSMGVESVRFPATYSQLFRR